MKLISWNVNGIRACVKNGFMDFFTQENADIFCIQETKIQEDQIPFNLNGYYQYWNFAQKKGYSGTAVFSKIEPIRIAYGIGIEEHDQEGRLITLEFEKFFLVTVYAPNSQKGLMRLEYRMKWEEEFFSYLKGLERSKPVIFCGDLNVAHQEIDLKNPGANRKNAGFSAEERNKFGEIISSGFVDTFRFFYPEKIGAYTWWSYMFNARAKNVGWRIDYFCVSAGLINKLKDAVIYKEVFGSDHCPVGLEIF